MAITTHAEVVLRFGQKAVDAVIAAAHTAPITDSAQVALVFNQALATAEEELWRPLMGLYETLIAGWDANASTAPLALVKLAQELVMIVLRERADQATPYEMKRWIQIVGEDTPLGHRPGILDRYGNGELKLKGVSLPTFRRVRTNVNDGRVPETKRSHYDNDFNRIEGDTERTPLDKW